MLPSRGKTSSSDKTEMGSQAHWQISDIVGFEDWIGLDWIGRAAVTPRSDNLHNLVLAGALHASFEQCLQWTAARRLGPNAIATTQSH